MRRLDPPLGRLLAIARRPARRLPMELLEAADVSTARGVHGDHKGARFPNRAVTILAREDWEVAIATLADLAGPVPLSWTARRANLLVEGVRLPRARSAVIAIGAVRLGVTYQTVPCGRMDEAHAGLLKALLPDWRGGVTCRVLEGGRIAIGDAVRIVSSPPERAPARIPG